MKIAARVALILGFAGLASCASIAPPSAEQVVRERAQMRLDLLTSPEWRKAYDFSSPNYRATEDLTLFSLRYGGAGNWLSANVINVACDAESASRCEVDTEVTYNAPSGGFVMDRVLKETWILVDGNWYKFEE